MHLNKPELSAAHGKSVEHDALSRPTLIKNKKLLAKKP